MAQSEISALIYARLSDEDRNKQIEGELSKSIVNQLDILTDICLLKGFGKPIKFYDDDRTGTNFERSGFQKMCEYVVSDRSKQFVILIKNVDRFGSNYVQSGLYFEKLADMGVRIIFTDNGIDTQDNHNVRTLPYLFIGAEAYSQTLSDKVKSVRRHQWSKGYYLATYEPYGYLKSVEDKHKLVIDNGGSADTVRRIYAERLSGKSAKLIADGLNIDGVLSPLSYWLKRVEREDRDKPEEQRRKLNRFGSGFWSKDTVKSILENRVYIGDVCNNKKPRISFKNHHIDRKDVADWVIAEGVHAAIVSKEDYDRVQAMKQNMGRVRSTKTKEILPFAGLLRCPDCGLAMTQNSGYYTLKDGTRKKHTHYNCNGYGRSHLQCSNHYISANDLSAIVLADIQAKSAEIAQDE